MSGILVKYQWSGFQGMQQVMRELPRRVRTRVTQRLVSKVATKMKPIIKRSIKSTLPTKAQRRAKARTYSRRRLPIWDTPTGAMHNSIGKWKSKKRKKVVTERVGVRRGFKVNKPVAARVAKLTRIGNKRVVKAGSVGIGGGSKNKIDPVRYGYLVEYGHKRGKGIVAAKAYPFMEKSKRKGRIILLQVFRQEFPPLLESEYGKLLKRNAKKKKRLK